jgi:hypothetical protein
MLCQLHCYLGPSCSDLSARIAAPSTKTLCDLDLVVLSDMSVFATTGCKFKISNEMCSTRNNFTTCNRELNFLNPFMGVHNKKYFNYFMSLSVLHEEFPAVKSMAIVSITRHPQLCPFAVASNERTNTFGKPCRIQPSPPVPEAALGVVS